MFGPKGNPASLEPAEMGVTRAWTDRSVPMADLGTQYYWLANLPSARDVAEEALWPF